MNKTCCKCKLEKSLDDFYKNPSATDKVGSVCESCYKITRHNLYLKHKDKIKQRSKIWKKNNPDKLRESNRKSINRRRKKNPLLRIRHSLNSRLLNKLKCKR